MNTFSPNIKVFWNAAMVFSARPTKAYIDYGIDRLFQLTYRIGETDSSLIFAVAATITATHEAAHHSLQEAANLPITDKGEGCTRK